MMGFDPMETLARYQREAGELAADLAELRRLARAVVDARYAPGGDWETLKDAIAELAEVVGGGEL